MTTITNTTTNATTETNTTTPVTVPSTAVTPPAFLHRYNIFVELKTTDSAVINLLRSVLGNTSYPISINNSISINSVDISTVCSPNNDSYKCTCEEQYRWSCDLCLSYGSCDNIFNDTCGCILDLPPDGQYCRPLDSNFTACPSTTPPPTTPPSTTHVPTLVTSPTTNTTVNTTESLTTRNTTTSPITITTPNTTPSSPNTTTTDPNTTITTLITTASPNTTTPSTTFPNPTTTFPNTTTPSPNTTMTTLNTTTTFPNTTTTFPNTATPSPNTTMTTLIATTTSPNTTAPSPGTTFPSTTTTSPYTTTYFPVTTTTLSFTPTTTPNLTTTTTHSNTSAPPNTTTTYNSTTFPINTTIFPSPTTTTPVLSPTTSPDITTSAITTTTLSITTTPQTTTTTATTTTTTTATATATTTTTATPATTTITTTAPTPTTTAAGPTTTTTTTTPEVTRDPETTPNPPKPTTTIAPQKGQEVEISMKLDKQFTPELFDTSSEAYQNLKGQVHSVLDPQYRSLTGFIAVNVNGFSPGSVVTQYVVEASQIKTEEIIAVNKQIPEAMKEVAPVIGSVTASLIASDSLTIPPLTYTGKSMTLNCGPPPTGINLSVPTGVEWKFNEVTLKDGRRYSINTNGLKSSLTVNQVIPADAGQYECTLKGTDLNYIQRGYVNNTNNIKQAPNIRVNGEINAKCDGLSLELPCCVQSNYKVKWLNETSDVSPGIGEYCIKLTIMKTCASSQTKIYTCQEETLPEYKRTTLLNLFPVSQLPTCVDDIYGTGRVGDTSVIGCEKGQEGRKRAVCESNGRWKLVEDTCIVEEIKNLLTESEDLDPVKVPGFVEKLNQVVETRKEVIAGSSNTISAIVGMVGTVSDVSVTVTEPVMKNVLEVVDKLSADNAAPSWQFLNRNQSSNVSSQLLGALEHLSEGLKGEFSISTQRIALNRTTFSNSFSVNLNSSIYLDIPNAQLNNVSITTIIFSSLNNIMPPRDASFNISQLTTNTTRYTDNDTVPIVFDSVINADVVLVKVNQEINNVTLTYEKRNDSLSQNPQCVFWNFSLLYDRGAWDTEGCSFVSDVNGTVTCNCNHLTSFSILMSTQIPKSIRRLLDIITYIGVGISLGSLVICLIIEGYVWKSVTRNSTAFMRHVSIVNTALCLLIADICFIIAASVAKNPLENPDENYEVPVGPCSTATFFMHFFYLALFFWMLVSGLLLFYRTVMVFSHMSRSTMLAVGFCVGYGAPLIIAVVTVAVTASGKGYIRRHEACWLNWNETMALLALVIPALAIVFINMIILFVVLYKMLRSGGIGDSTQNDERHTLKVIVRCVLILTPLFGLTWSLGVGTMVAPTNEGIHIAFAFFNSLQGLFILVFGTLFDSKIRAILSRKSPTTRTSGSSSNRTRSSNVPSDGFTNYIRSIFPGRRDVYHLSQALNSSSSDPVASYSSI